MHIIIIEPEAKLDIALAIHQYNSYRAGLGREFFEDLKTLLLRVAKILANTQNIAAKPTKPI